MIIKLQHPRFKGGSISTTAEMLTYPTDDEGYLLDPNRYYFEIQAEGNFETIATSEIYESKQAARHAIFMITSCRQLDWTVKDDAL